MLLCLVCFLHEVPVPCPDSLMCRQAKHLASTDVRRLLYLLTWSLWSASGCLLPNLCQVFAHERQSESSYSNLCAAVNTVLVARAKRHWVQKTLVARRRVTNREDFHQTIFGLLTNFPRFPSEYTDHSSSNAPYLVFKDRGRERVGFP
ncbi:hypothetical protein BDW22DRAFT_1242622 [Trametopsis cervina]|nr:hypothetical protein BDW22DRAFT_1242622 [Trametopsis cervina]